VGNFVECRYPESSDRKRRREANKVYGITGGSIPEVRQQGQKIQQKHSFGPNEREQLNDSGEETSGEWSLDIDNFLDPMLSPQLDRPDSPMDMASDMPWDAFLGGDHSSLGQ
jgi:hypothetical protein